MALNSSGPISLAGSTLGESIALELSLSATAQISLNDSALRTLANIVSGVISLSNFRGASAFIAKGVFFSNNNYPVFEVLDMTTEVSASSGLNQTGFHGIAAAGKNKIAYLEGYSGTAFRNHVYQYDIATNTYTHTGYMPSSIYYSGACSTKNVIYRRGGYRGNTGLTTGIGYVADTEAYNWNTNVSYTVVVSGNNSYYNAGAQTTTKGYIVGGFTNTVALTTPYNIASGYKFNFATETYDLVGFTVPYHQATAGTVLQDSNSMWWKCSVSAQGSAGGADGLRISSPLQVFQTYNLDVSRLLQRLDFATDAITVVGTQTYGGMGGQYSGSASDKTKGYISGPLITGSISPTTAWSSGLQSSGGNIGEKFVYATQTYSLYTAWVNPNSFIAPITQFKAGSAPLQA